MSPAPEPPAAPPLPLSTSRRVDQVCRRFETEWLRGRRQPIESLVDGVPDPERSVLLAELIGIALELSRQEGAHPSATEYKDRFPGDASLIDSVFQETVAAHDTSVAAFRPEVPGYRIDGELGRGGMGVVYRAWQEALKRPVALKMILTGRSADPAQRARFRAEAEAIARLHHSNIVQIHEVGEVEGHLFFSLEYVEGGSLDARLTNVPQPPRPVAEFVRTLALAVHHAHERGIVHRDLKPANILMEARITPEAIDQRAPSAGGASLLGLALADCIPKITDFGLAKQLTEESGQTRSGELLGTPGYMAPEQAAGRLREIGPASDVYALGAILYELLGGSRPFRSASPLETVFKVLNDDPEPLSRLSRNCPRDLETICLKCLHKEPPKRYASALALADDLERYLQGLPIQARAVGSLERLGRWCRRNPALAALGGLAAMAVVAVVMLSTLLALREARSSRVLNAALKTSERYRFRSEYRLAESYLDRAIALDEAGETAKCMLWLARSLETAPADAADLRRVIRTNLAAWRSRTSPLTAVLPHSERVAHAVFSPDGTTILTVTQSGTAQLWNAATGKKRGAAFVHQIAAPPHFSPDGQRVLTVGQGQAQLWDTATGKAAGPPLAHAGEVVIADVSPDGKWILTAGQDRTVRLWHAATLQPAGAPWPHPVGISAALFSPDSQAVLIKGPMVAQLWDTAAGQPIGQPLRHDGAIYSASFRGDGKVLATGGPDATVRLWDVATAAPLGAPLVHPTPVASVMFSPDGKHLLALCGASGACWLWNLETRRSLAGPLAHPEGVNSAAFSPDSQFLATAGRDYSTRLWETATGELRGEPLRHTNAGTMVAIGPDSHTVLTAGVDGVAWLMDAMTGRAVDCVLRSGHIQGLAMSSRGARFLIRSTNDVRVWDLATRSAAVTVLAHAFRVDRVAFSRDGTRLVMACAEVQNGPHQMRVWDLDRGEPVAEPLATPFDVRRLAFSPDGRAIAVCGRTELLDAQGQRRERGIVQLYDVGSGKPIEAALDHPAQVRAVAFSRDGKTLLTGCDDHRARRWDLVTRTVIGAPLVHGGEIGSIAWSDDESTIVTGGTDHLALLWDAATAKPRGTPLRHLDWVTALALSPSGRTVVTGSDDATARLWDVASGTPISPALDHGDSVEAVAFSRDGGMIVTAAGDGSARLWDVATGRPLGPASPTAGAALAVGFRSDGRMFETALRTRAGTGVRVQVWHLPIAVQGSLERIVLWTQVLTGMELDADGFAYMLEPDAWRQRSKRLQTLGGPP